MAALPAQANMLKDAILEVLQERLEKTIDKDFKDSEYWQNLLENVANGTPEVVVQQIMDDYDMNSFAKDTGMKLLERLVPEAAGPIGLLLVANEAVYEYTNYMLDFYKDQRMKDFADAVLKPSKTRRELRANYNTFVNEYVNMGMSDTNVLPTERKAMEAKFEQVFLQAFAKMAKAERAMEARQSAKKLAVRKFKIMRAEVKAQVEGATAYLQAAALQPTAPNIKRFLQNSSNNDFAHSVRRAAAEAAKTEEQKKKEKPAPDVKPEQDPKGKPPAPKPGSTPQAEPVKVAVPAQPGGGPIGLSLNLRKTGDSPETPRTLDYSPYFSAYKDAADKLVAGDLPGTVFEEAASNIWTGAQRAYSGCIAASSVNTGQTNECVQAHKRFSENIGQIRRNINDMADRLKSELDAYPARLRAHPPASEKLKELTTSIAPDAEIVEKSNACSFGIEGLTAEEAGKKIEGCKTFIGFLATFINSAEAKAQEFQDYAKAYDDKISADYAAYSDRYAANYTLAAFAGLTLDTAILKTLLDESAAAQNSLADSRSALGEGYAARLRTRLSSLISFNREAESQLALSQAFLAAQTAPAAEVEKAAVIQRKSGGPLDLRSFSLRSYYDESFRDLFQELFSGVFALLTAKGYDPSENMSYKGSPLLVWEASKYPFYKSAAGHEAALKDFDDRIAALKEFELERRRDVLARGIKAAETSFSAIKTPTTDARALYRAFQGAAPARDSLAGALSVSEFGRLFYGGEFSLSSKLMDEVRAEYAKRVEEIKAKERNMVAIFTKYRTAPPQDGKGNYHKDLMDARTDMNCKRWECSPAVWEAYKAMGDALEKRSADEFKKYSPIKSLSLNGRPVPQRSSQSIELTEKDLIGGELVLKGELQPGTIGAVSKLMLALHGKEHDLQISLSESFEFAFRPEEGRRYYISVKPELGGIGRAEPWPADGEYFSVEYLKGGQEEVKTFYEKFRAAYEGRNASAVMALISPDWNSGDDVGDFQDLDSSLRASFRVYDEIKYVQSGLRVTRVNGNWQACYDVAITSRIYKRNLVHEEKSAVCEELREEGGRFKIARTLSGSYWSLK